jgi:hypothetical protein
MLIVLRTDYAVAGAQSEPGLARVQGPALLRPVASGDGGRAADQRVRAERHGAAARRHPSVDGGAGERPIVRSVAPNYSCAHIRAAFGHRAKERTKGSAFADGKSTLRFKLVFKVRFGSPFVCSAHSLLCANRRSTHSTTWSRRALCLATASTSTSNK